MYSVSCISSGGSWLTFLCASCVVLFVPAWTETVLQALELEWACCARECVLECAGFSLCLCVCVVGCAIIKFPAVILLNLRLELFLIRCICFCSYLGLFVLAALHEEDMIFKSRLLEKCPSTV